MKFVLISVMCLVIHMNGFNTESLSQVPKAAVSETGSAIKVPFALVTSGNMLDNILRLERAVTNLSWQLELSKSDLISTKAALATVEKKLASQDGVTTNETGSAIKVPFALVTSGNMLDNILRLERAVTNLSWQLELSKSDLISTKAALATVEKKLASQDGVTTNGRPGISFQVKQSKGPYTPGEQEPLKFDTVIPNEGYGYNPTSGIFTVPSAGNYLCWANVLPDNKNSMHVRLMKEGLEIVRGYTRYGPGRPGTATITYLMEFEKGDHVWFDLKEPL